MNDRVDAPDLADASATFERIIAAVTSVISGHQDKLRLILAAFAAQGHVLLEDYPGTGKTTMAKAIAKAVGASRAGGG